jgi:hypothetical protein
MRLLERGGPRAPAQAADLPELPIDTSAASWRHSVLVLLEPADPAPPAGADDALRLALPIGWALSRSAETVDPLVDVIVVVPASDGQAVARARARHPRDPLLAIVPAMADSSVVVDTLDAGADACVRTAGAAVVASHLLSMQRRRELERVAQLTRPEFAQ